MNAPAVKDSTAELITTPKQLEALNTAFMEARQKVGDAKKRLAEVLADLEESTKKQLKAEFEMSGDGVATLIDYAANNESLWSGGVSSVSNIVEHTFRSVAIGLLKTNERRKSLEWSLDRTRA